ncbi:DUF859 family phage minor structural protein [Fervidibacillus albus]|uniref:DUF859 domain-containing protein n=1 Tax=Fervidibacillus albus TaxID=2980026 RepID=A0A9E8RWQ8_9BACI|nr:DUF859 family phage minor structural protein [Fervidibacillus albus]WAA10338.1 DUF859 domain-containing protein [Fervidibacillus albus]
MATSGYFDTSNPRIVYWIEAFINSQSTSGNYSNVTVRVWFKRTNSGYQTWGTGTVYCKINGTQYTSNVTPDQKITSTPIKLFEKTLNIYHNSDGTKNLALSAKISHNAPLNSDWHSWNYTLTTIPRASVPTMDKSTVEYGQSVMIYTNPASSSFKHTLRYNWNGRTGTIASNVGSSYTWTIPTSFMNYIPNSTSTTGTIYCDTYSGSTKIGTKSITLKTTVPSNVKPTFSTVTHNEVVSTVSTIVGQYVKNLSKLNLSITGASGAYNSTIKSYQITVDGKTYNSQSTVSETLQSSGTLTITGKVTDSRGRSYSKSITINVLNYEPPSITNLAVKRTSSDGSENLVGEYASVSQNITLYDLNGKNAATIKIKSKLKNNQLWETKYTKTITNDYEGTVVLNGFDIDKSYNIMIQVEDQFNISSVVFDLSTGVVPLSWSKTGIGVGKVWERGTADIGGDTYIDGDLYIQNYLSWHDGNVLFDSNSNGSYIRFPNGVQICFMRRQTSGNGGTTYI